jgi:heat shock protein HslJ
MREDQVLERLCPNGVLILMAAEPDLPPEPDTLIEEQEDDVEKAEEKMGRGFYLALGLVVLLVVLILVLNVPGIRASAGSMMTQDTWTLESYTNASGILIPVMQGPVVTARFGADGSVFGSAGCNRYFGRYSVNEYSITVSNLSATEMYCTQPGIMPQETAYLGDLGNASSFRVGSGYLKMYDRKGNPLLVFGSS